MAAPSVGQDIEALCGRCGTVWHVVMAVVGDRIAKVVCKRCNGHHRYRTENGAADEPATGAASQGRRTGPPRRPSRHAASRTPQPLPTFDPSKPPRTYAARDLYETGERVAHPSFGTGIVTGAPAPGRVEVAFPSGARTLACAKTASTLARPVAVAVPISDRPPDPAK